MGSCALGISGIIFGLIVCDTHLSGVQMRSIFGLFTVPAQFYPLALLVFCQLILPRASLFGHLGGLLAGQLLIMGALNCVVPGSSRLQVDTWHLCSFCFNHLKFLKLSVELDVCL